MPKWRVRDGVPLLPPYVIFMAVVTLVCNVPTTLASPLATKKHVSSPLFTKSRTVHLPMPVLEPVTIAVFPSSRALPLYVEQQTIVTLHSDSCHNTHWNQHDVRWRLEAHCRARYSATRRRAENISWKPCCVILSLILSLSFKLHLTTQPTYIDSPSGTKISTCYFTTK